VTSSTEQTARQDAREEELQADVHRLRDLVAQHDGTGLHVLHDLFTGGSDSRGPGRDSIAPVARLKGVPGSRRIYRDGGATLQPCWRPTQF
jgi:hypothetical protein